MPEGQSGETAKAKTVFEEFLLAEYNNIADAHHISVSTMTAFFKHYLLIMSVPVSAIVLMLTLQARSISTAPPTIDTAVILGGTLLLFTLGIVVMVYIINLRIRALLYARTVNGIRCYFADSNPGYKKYLVLPTLTNKPSYREWGEFGPVILTFALVNTAYLVGGTLSYLGSSPHTWVLLILILIVSIILHALVYRLVTRIAEKDFKEMVKYDITDETNKSSAPAKN